MEIHVPDHPVTGWRETAKHLAIITAGVLIALTLEGLVSWFDHRMLVREAVENLTEEIRNNRKELDGMLANLASERKQLEHADDIAEAMLNHKTQEKFELSLNENAAELKNAAVTTGQITGAFGYMDYGAVSRYASVYDFQAQFMRMQERDGQAFQAVLSFIPRFAESSTPSPASLEEWRGRIYAAMTAVGIREQIGRQLLKRYDEVLK
jgi:hypothetical protein